MTGRDPSARDFDKFGQGKSRGLDACKEAGRGRAGDEHDVIPAGQKLRHAFEVAFKGRRLPSRRVAGSVGDPFLGEGIEHEDRRRPAL